MKKNNSLLTQRIRNIFLKENNQFNEEPPFYLSADIIEEILKSIYDSSDKIPFKIILNYFKNNDTSNIAYIQNVYITNMKKIYNIVQQRLKEVSVSKNEININWKPTIENIIKKIFSENPELSTFVFYVHSKDSPKYNSIGIIYRDNKFEIFEGNDHSDSKTIQIANKIVFGNKPKYVKVYGSHNNKIVEYIESTGLLPPNLYVSPKREYAEGYWGEDRILFSGIINANDVSQESEVDWKTVQETPIQNFKYE